LKPGEEEQLELRSLIATDPGAFCICAFTGILVRFALGPAFWVEFAEIIFAYNLFLIWLLFLSEKKGMHRRISYGIMVAIHAGCLAVLVFLKLTLAACLFSVLQMQSPANVSTAYFLGTKIVLIVLFLSAYWLALYERRWLMGTEKNMPSKSSALSDSEDTATNSASHLEPAAPQITAEAD